MYRRLMPGLTAKRRLAKARQLLERDGNGCFWAPCSVRFTSEYDPNLTIDHVIPLSYGGAVKDLRNLVLACGRCNSRRRYDPHAPLPRTRDGEQLGLGRDTIGGSGTVLMRMANLQRGEGRS